MTPLYGLVVCGGRSSRMGTDKSLLNYHGKPQRYFLYEMLQPLCERVFISCNREQVADIPASFEALIDEPEYEGIGPMAALLTAFKNYPDNNFLMVGCDYPFINTTALKVLSKAKLQSIFAAAYYNKEAGLYEPLLSLYQHNIKNKLEHNFKLKNYSLQQVLKEVNAEKVLPESHIFIKSIDTEEEYKKALMLLHNTTNNNAF